MCQVIAGVKWNSPRALDPTEVVPMRCFLFGLAWMLLGSSLTATIGAAEDAATLPSVMVRGPAASAPPATSPAPAGAEAPAWQPSAAPAPQTLPDMSDAKPLTPSADVVVGAGTESAAPATSDGKLLLPSPPDAQPEPSPIEPARYEETLPLPAGAGANAPAVSQPKAPAPMNSTPPSAPTSSIIAPPANASASADPAAQAAARAAADLLASSLRRDENSSLLAQPISLQQFMARIERQYGNWQYPLKTYWELSQAVSNYHWCVDELKRLDQVVPSRASTDASMLATARAAAAANAKRAELAVIVAQRAMISSAEAYRTAATGTISSESTAWHPTDQPLVGPYVTHFQKLYEARQPIRWPSANGPFMPTTSEQREFSDEVRWKRAEHLDRILPMELKVFNDSAAAVQSAMSAVHYSEQAHARGEADMRTVLACHKELHDQRRLFLYEVLKYNLGIAEYVAAVVPNETATEKLAAMLVRPKQPLRPSSSASVTSLPPGTTGNPPSATHGGWMPSQARGGLQPVPPATASVPAANPSATSNVTSPAVPSTTPPGTTSTPTDPFSNPSVGSRYNTPSR
jgi:hypothetical protein